MAQPLSFTPPDRDARPVADAPVRRRHVLSVPGYDPESESRSRMLFVRELIRYAKRFGLTERRIGPVQQDPDVPALAWDVAAGTERWRTQTRFEVLRWDDIVIADFKRPLPVAMGLLYVALLHSLVTGAMVRFWRLNWKFGGVIVYPPVMVTLTLALAGGAGYGLARLVERWVAPPGWALALLGLAVASLVILGLKPLGRRWFVWHLLFDWLFNWQHGSGLRADYEARVGRFADRLIALVEADEADEILVVGHSSGAPMATEVVGEALLRRPDLGGRATLSLLTLGSCTPLVAINPLARLCRARIASIAASRRVTWVDYQAPQDWLNFAGFNPLRDLRLPLDGRPAVNPIIRSSRFKEIVAPATYEKILYRPFRMHFQFLMSNDMRGEYDYVLMMVGPRTLAARVFGADEPDETAAPVLSDGDLAEAEIDRVSSR